MSALRFGVVAFAALALFACNTDSLQGYPAQRLVDKDWRAETINDVPVSIPNPVTLSFNEGNASGRSGCNQYSGMVEYDNSHIKFGTLISTEMACIAGNAMQVETAYLSGLQSVRAYSFDGSGKLILRGNKTSIRFAPQSRQIRP